MGPTKKLKKYESKPGSDRSSKLIDVNLSLKQGLCSIIILPLNFNALFRYYV